MGASVVLLLRHGAPEALIHGEPTMQARLLATCHLLGMRLVEARPVLAAWWRLARSSRARRRQVPASPALLCHSGPGICIVSNTAHIGHNRVMGRSCSDNGWIHRKYMGRGVLCSVRWVAVATASALPAMRSTIARRVALRCPPPTMRLAPAVQAWRPRLRAGGRTPMLAVPVLRAATCQANARCYQHCALWRLGQESCTLAPVLPQSCAGTHVALS